MVTDCLSVLAVTMYGSRGVREESRSNVYSQIDAAAGGGDSSRRLSLLDGGVGVGC